MGTINVKTEKPYEVRIASGLLQDTGKEIKTALPDAQKICVISDTNVYSLYGDRVTRALADAGFVVSRFVFAPGEESKNSDTYVKALGALASEQLTRSDAVVALGGGVVGDLAGFAAATYLRGIPYVQIPTSLLAMVDSSVGGKTAIDLPQGKNLAGAFCQPEAVLCDPDVLRTLPEAVFTDGCAEVIKYGILDDRALFDHLMQHGPSFDREYVISTCIAIKADYVAKDEFDTGIRLKLNLGHTIGHGIEKASGYSVSHGRAVAIGMAMIADAAEREGILAGADAAGIRAVLNAFGLPTETAYTTEELLPAMQGDKKRRGSLVSLILPHTIGHCEIHTVPVEELPRFLKKPDGIE